MTRREKFVKTMRREMEGYIPFDFALTPSIYERFKENKGTENYFDYYDMPIRFICPRITNNTDIFKKYFVNKKIDLIGDWGVGYRRGSVEHFLESVSPMEDFTSIEEFESFPYIDPVKDYDWDSYLTAVKSLQERDIVVAAPLGCTIFEQAWAFRGYENFMVDLMFQPEFACYIMDRLVEIKSEMAKRCAEAGVDMIELGDDVSTQLDMMMSPDLWRKYLKPRLKKVIDAIRAVNPDMLIEYHGDGNLQKIIPDLIEVGIDILNPVQPECMDPVKIKEMYGDRLSFRGTVGTQTTMPFGTPEDVDRVCKEMIEKVGKGGGLILAPTHVIEPEVPLENIDAFVNAIRKYSKV